MFIGQKRIKRSLIAANGQTQDCPFNPTVWLKGNKRDCASRSCTCLTSKGNIGAGEPRQCLGLAWRWARSGVEVPTATSFFQPVWSPGCSSSRAPRTCLSVHLLANTQWPSEEKPTANALTFASVRPICYWQCFVVGSESPRLKVQSVWRTTLSVSNSMLGSNGLRQVLTNLVNM